MAFISSCPKCQKQVLVPDGTCPDAVVQCPICSGEYSLGDLLAAAPPSLIVIHAGSTAVTAAPAAPLDAAAVSATVPPPESSEVSIFSAHRVEPSLHDAEPLLFEGDEVQLATPDYGHAEFLGHEGPEHAAEAALFEPSPAAPQESAQQADQPIEALAEPFGEPMAAPLSEEGHDLSAAPADGEAPWGGGWGGFKDEIAQEEDGTVSLAEPDEDEGLENVNFAAITGKAAPGSAPAARHGDVTVAAEPPKKKRRKREANMLVRFIGMAFMGLLALVCVFGLAAWMHIKMDSPGLAPVRFQQIQHQRRQHRSSPGRPSQSPRFKRLSPAPIQRRAMPLRPLGVQPDQATGDDKAGPRGRARHQPPMQARDPTWQ